MNAVGHKESYSKLEPALKEGFVPQRHPKGPIAPPMDSGIVKDKEKDKGATSPKRSSMDKHKGQEREKDKAVANSSRPRTAGEAERLHAAAGYGPGSSAPLKLSAVEALRRLEREGAGSVGNGSCDSVPDLRGPAPILKVVVTSGQDMSKPYNTAKRFERLAAENLDPRLNAEGQYVGLYTEVYRSALEQEIHDYNQAKRGFVGPAFKTFSGVASQIPLRKEGQVRPMGAYPKAPPPGLGDVKAGDWNMGFLQRENEEKNRRLAGGWRK
jgi:hypothetical protein